MVFLLREREDEDQKNNKNVLCKITIFHFCNSWQHGELESWVLYIYQLQKPEKLLASLSCTCINWLTLKDYHSLKWSNWSGKVKENILIQGDFVGMAAHMSKVTSHMIFHFSGFCVKIITWIPGNNFWLSSWKSVWHLIIGKSPLDWEQKVWQNRSVCFLWSAHVLQVGQAYAATPSKKFSNFKPSGLCKLTENCLFRFYFSSGLVRL